MRSLSTDSRAADGSPSNIATNRRDRAPHCLPSHAPCALQYSAEMLARSLRNRGAFAVALALAAAWPASRPGLHRPQCEPEARGHPAHPGGARREDGALHGVPAARARLVASGEARAHRRDARDEHSPALLGERRRSRHSCSSPTTPSRFATECGGRRSPMCSSSRGTRAATSSGRSIASIRDAKEPVLLTDPARANSPAAINRARNRLLVTSTDVDKTSGPRENPTLDLALVDPLAPDKNVEDRHVAGHRLGGFLVLVRRPAARAGRSSSRSPKATSG